MHGRRPFLLATAAGLCGLGLPRLGWATDVDRSVAQAYSYPTPESEIDTGGAIIGIHGPLSEVYRVVTDYARYVDILPRLSMSRVVRRHGRSADVYLRAPIMRGVNHVWGVARFTPYKWRTQGRKIIARYRKGNLDGFRGIWKMYPCSATRTVLRLELFLDPQVPVPASVVTPELIWSSKKGVTAVRDVVECRRSTVKND